MDNISVDADFDNGCSYVYSDISNFPEKYIGEQHLWCAVLHQWKKDLNEPSRREKEIEWLRTKDCTFICELVGINKRALVKVVQKMLHDLT